MPNLLSALQDIVQTFPTKKPIYTLVLSFVYKENCKFYKFLLHFYPKFYTLLSDLNDQP